MSQTKGILMEAAAEYGLDVASPELMIAFGRESELWKDDGLSYVNI